MNTWTKRVLSFLAAALLAVAGYGVAQDQTNTTQDQTNTTQDQTNTTQDQASTTQEGQQTPSLEHLRMVMSDLQAQIEALQGLQEVSFENVQIVGVRQFVALPDDQGENATASAGEGTSDQEDAPPVAGGGEGEASAPGSEGQQAAEGEERANVIRAQTAEFEELVSTNQQAIMDLHAALENNSTVMQALQRQDIALEEVIAVEVTAEQEIVVYIRDMGDEEGRDQEEQSTGAGDDSGAGTGEDEPEGAVGDDSGEGQEGGSGEEGQNTTDDTNQDGN